MTREEAKEILGAMAWEIYNQEAFDENKIGALDVAIKTLQHEQERREDIYECPNCLGEVHINYVYCPFCGIRFVSSDGNISNAKSYSAYERVTHAWNRRAESEE